MLDNEMLKWFATMGIGGVLAGFMFLFYRKDVKEDRELWRGQAMALLTVVKENTASNVAVVKSVEANTRMVEAMHKRLDLVERGRRN